MLFTTKAGKSNNTNMQLKRNAFGISIIKKSPPPSDTPLLRKLANWVLPKNTKDTSPWNTFSQVRRIRLIFVEHLLKLAQMGWLDCLGGGQGSEWSLRVRHGNDDCSDSNLASADKESRNKRSPFFLK